MGRGEGATVLTKASRRNDPDGRTERREQQRRAGTSHEARRRSPTHSDDFKMPQYSKSEDSNKHVLLLIIVSCHIADNYRNGSWYVYITTFVIKVFVYNYRLNNFNLSVSDDNLTYTDCASYPSDDHPEQRITLPCETTGRYVRFLKVGTGKPADHLGLSLFVR